ncbi:MAG: DUF5606 domain-containing protein [Flavobacteriia bacterium]|nr:DUF5606 domain-containing protein [Flavobacteriia bacterium]
MNLDKILSIAGKPGLFQMLTQTRGGFVAVSLLDGKKVTVNLKSNVSVLSEIAIYTLEEEMPLVSVLEKIHIKESGGKTSVAHKADKLDLEAYFFEVLPNYDEDRVYASDIKKVVQWYNILHENKLLDFSEKATKVAAEEGAKPTAKKAAAKPVAPKSKANPKQGGAKASSAAKGGAKTSKAAVKK